MSHLGFADPWGTCSQKVENLFTRSSSGEKERGIGGNFIVIKVDGGGPILTQAIDLITRAECGTENTAPDPLLDWVYHGKREEGTFGPLPEAPSSHRLAWFGWLTYYTILFGVNRRSVYALVDKVSRKVVAAAISCPPRTTPFS